MHRYKNSSSETKNSQNNTIYVVVLINISIFAMKQFINTKKIITIIKEIIC
jgi:hypothetical protein